MRQNHRSRLIEQELIWKKGLNNIDLNANAQLMPHLTLLVMFSTYVLTPSHALARAIAFRTLSLVSIIRRQFLTSVYSLTNGFMPRHLFVKLMIILKRQLRYNIIMLETSSFWGCSLVTVTLTKVQAQAHKHCFHRKWVECSYWAVRKWTKQLSIVSSGGDELRIQESLLTEVWSSGALRMDSVGPLQGRHGGDFRLWVRKVVVAEEKRFRITGNNTLLLEAVPLRGIESVFL